MDNSTKCSKRVFSGARWDFGGHMCQAKATVERDGKTWCKRHDPKNEEAKRQKRTQEFRSREKRSKDNEEEGKKLLKALGIKDGCPNYDSVFTKEYTRGITISFEDARALLKKLGK